MLQRDYIMRLLQQFFEALEKLVEERDKKDGPELQLQLQSIYRAYFNHTKLSSSLKSYVFPPRRMKPFARMQFIFWL